MTAIMVTAAPGRRVRIPDGTVLAEGESATVERDLFVARRLADGDLVEMPATAGGSRKEGAGR